MFEPRKKHYTLDVVATLDSLFIQITCVFDSVLVSLEELPDHLVFKKPNEFMDKPT